MWIDPSPDPWSPRIMKNIVQMAKEALTKLSGTYFTFLVQNSYYSLTVIGKDIFSYFNKSIIWKF